jgi:hypothetical protein
MTSSFWSVDLSWSPLLTGGVALSVALWLAWRNLRHARVGQRLVWLELLRLLVVGLLIVTLCKPERVRTARRTELPVVAVLGDASGSMATRDVVGSNATVLARGAWLAAQQAARGWQPLEEKYRVVVSEFEAVSTQAAARAAQPDPGTDINQALEEAARLHGNLRAILLLSDGDWNLGKSTTDCAAHPTNPKDRPGQRKVLYLERKLFLILNYMVCWHDKHRDVLTVMFFDPKSSHADCWCSVAALWF